MEERVFEVEGKFGVMISCFGYVPEEVIGVIHIFHGMGEHKQRYQNFMKWMAKKGYAIFAHDHRKHGKSIDEEFYKAGEFTEADKFEYVIDDAHYVIRHTKNEFTDVPYILLGHSMGSILARRYLQKYTTVMDYAILSGTLPIITKGKAMIPTMIAKMIRLFKQNKPSPFLAEMLNKGLIKHFDNPKTDKDWLSTDEKQVEKYVEDPLCGFAYTPEFYIGFFDMCVKVNQSELISEGKDIPVLFISGKNDPVGEFGQGVKEVYELYNAHGYFQLTIKLIDEMRHEILNETARTTSYKLIDEWIQTCLKN